MHLEDAMIAEVSRADAEREILLHQLDPADFFVEIGDRSTYTGAEVLGWLGY
ncbi:hypothetical protein [Granulicella tundricola]|uniref:Uncharacterized protein n=1 Tax=Granulicella tundricola (strain ATCC BAA-1859 / DSM 23138 / MP5ACTX9) TaxID=1198114 RepID=E8X7G5_GRATM|nr:hypothetical protein [Granulicella tundricola]ADW71399.1 hypothetical protein AciX9_4453 [Granulicella tundricola MP5ACTX9]